jgi:hypothetical protein
MDEKLKGTKRNGSVSMYFSTLKGRVLAPAGARQSTNPGRTACLLAALVATGAVFTGCGAKEAAEASPTVTVQVDAAEKGPIQRKVVTDAVLYPRDQAAIVPRVVSSVEKW